MKYYSTNKIAPKVSLTEAVAHGYAPDMGLYIPETLPSIPVAFIKNMSGMSLQDISYAIANTLFGTDVPSEVLREIVLSTVNFEIPLTHIHDNIFSLELYHGPSLNFKDVGTRFMARLMSYLLGEKHQSATINIITATSGGSGGAIASGFFDVPGVHVYVLFPHNKLSKTLEAQFTTLGRNITAIEVNGTYNDCQDLVREAFADKQLSTNLHLTSANSINIARLLPQTFYYFYAYAQLSARMQPTPDLTVAIPCGNFGNLVSAVISKKMGLPIKKIIAATGPNCNLTKFMQTGKFVSSETYPSIMPAMDVASPNNLPRLLPLFNNSLADLQACIETYSVLEVEASEAIKSVYNNYAYLIDPHTATAYHALQGNLPAGEVGIITATAHPGKSKRVIDSILGIDLQQPKTLVEAANRKRHVVKIPAIYSHLKRSLLESVQK